MTSLLAPQSLIGNTCRTLSGMGSEIRRVFMEGQEWKAQNPGRDFIDLSLGNPDLEPPQAVLDAMIQNLQSPEAGTHRYMDNAGYPHIRQFLSTQLTASEGVPVSPDAVFLTCGAAGGLQILMRTLIDPGDEVILFAPFFSEYQPYTVNLQAVPRILAPTENLQPNLEAFAQALTPKTKLVILNSPNNPSGVVWEPERIQKIIDHLKRHREKTGCVVHLISDEPYNRLAYPGVELAPVLKMYDAAWLVRSHSKDLGLAGERIGYVAWGPALQSPEIFGAMRNSARAIGFVNAPALLQRILPQVFHASVDTSAYEKRVKTFVSILNKGGLSCVMPGGGFFVFPKCPAHMTDDKLFCRKLMEAGVFVVPGSGFHAPGFFRASLTQPLEAVERAAAIIVDVAKK